MKKFLIIGLTIIISLIFFAYHGKNKYTFYGDALGYYSYLPSAFLYHNFNAIDSLPLDINIDRPILLDAQALRTNGIRSPKGYFVNQYTYGVALMELPFFALAHCHAKLIGGNANGYDSIYHYWIKLGTVIYALFGLLYIYLILLKFVPPNYAIATTCVLLLASNLFWFTLSQAGMAHVPLFFLFSITIFYTIKLHNSPKTIYFVIISFCIGLITIIRPSDIICLIIPLFYNIYNKESWSYKLKLIKQNLTNILIGGVVFLLPIIPQLLFWKRYAGSYFYYSYTTNGFHWDNPKILEGLFGFSNGWLAYSPIFYLSFFGMFYFKRIATVFLPFILILPIYIYIIYSWFCYNYINGFGSRPMIHLYPLLAIPLGVIIYKFWTKNNFSKIVIATLILFFCFYNLKLSWQQSEGQLFSDESNFVFVQQTLLKKNISVQDLIALDCEVVQPKKSTLNKLYTIDSWNLVDSGMDYYSITTDEYSNASLKNTINVPSNKNQCWIRASGEFYCMNYTNVYNNHMLVLEMIGNENCKLWKAIKINNKIGLNNNRHSQQKVEIVHNYLNEWDEVEMFIPVPECYLKVNQFKLYVWNIPRQKLRLRNLKLELWQQN